MDAACQTILFQILTYILTKVENYEVLVASPQAVRWKEASGPVQAQLLGSRPVEGGREANGSPLFIAQAPYKDGTHPGKAGEHLQGADITYGGDEKVGSTLFYSMRRLLSVMSTRLSIPSAFLCTLKSNNYNH
jgi:hypothetical protein